MWYTGHVHHTELLLLMHHVTNLGSSDLEMINNVLGDLVLLTSHLGKAEHLAYRTYPLLACLARYGWFRYRWGVGIGTCIGVCVGIGVGVGICVGIGIGIYIYINLLTGTAAGGTIVYL